ncbi:hypothetical protein AB0K92_05285 [Streptomyces sp. NPDC052687]|uniref:hypothetical protein n=1 Tax=Streptomyces sp. NPDC052687 TaxID=3154759 RepID=UPI00343FB6F9
MTSSSARARLTAGSVAASAVLLVSCTAGSGDTADASPSPSPTATSSAGSPGTSERKLTERVEAALAGFRDGTLVESGVERVSEGIHTEPTLTKGATYRLDLACAGTGSARLRLTPASAGRQATVPCDGTVVQQRIAGDGAIRIDVDGSTGATGMIAWQIDRA